MVAPGSSPSRTATSDCPVRLADEPSSARTARKTATNTRAAAANFIVRLSRLMAIRLFRASTRVPPRRGPPRGDPPLGFGSGRCDPLALAATGDAVTESGQDEHTRPDQDPDDRVRSAAIAAAAGT